MQEVAFGADQVSTDVKPSVVRLGLTAIVTFVLPAPLLLPVLLPPLLLVLAPLLPPMLPLLLPLLLLLLVVPLVTPDSPPLETGSMAPPQAASRDMAITSRGSLSMGSAIAAASQCFSVRLRNV